MIPLGVLGSSRVASASGPFQYLGTSASVQSATSTVTFTAMNLGAADANRVIVVALSSNISNTRTLTGVTIGGVAATIDAFTSTYSAAALARAVVPTGTTGDVVLTFSGTNGNGNVCAVYRAIGPITVTQAQNTKVSSTTASVTVTTAASGSVIAAVGGFNNTSAVTWTNVTQDYQNNAVGTSFPTTTSSAHADVAAGSLAVTVTKATSDSHLSLAAVAYQL